MTPDEVRLLDNRYALLFIRGERPVLDEKYEIMRHPNLALTTDGGMKPYLHGETTEDVATIQFVYGELPEEKASADRSSEEETYILLADEEIGEERNGGRR